MRVQQRTVLNAVLSLMITSVAATVSAGDHDYHDHHHDSVDSGNMQGSLAAHEHSAAKVGVVQEGTQLVFEFESPAYDIVGFEHTANTDAEKQKIRKSVDALARSSQLLEINPEARCKLEHVEINSPLSEVDEHEHHDEHDKHEEHDEHDEEHASETHSEFHVSYRFHCEKPADLKDLRLTAFTHYASLKEIEAVWVIEQGQGSAELSPRQPVISLTGSF